LTAPGDKDDGAPEPHRAGSRGSQWGARLRAGLNPWFLSGALFLLIGAVGVALPLLPTTPFVLVAAGCFAKSSPRTHAWLLRSQLFGPVIRSWDENRCISLRIKFVALSMMLVVGGSSVLFVVPPGWPQIAGIGLIAVGCVSVVMIKSCPRGELRGRD